MQACNIRGIKPGVCEDKKSGDSREVPWPPPGELSIRHVARFLSCESAMTAVANAPMGADLMQVPHNSAQYSVSPSISLVLLGGDDPAAARDAFESALGRFSHVRGEVILVRAAPTPLEEGALLRLARERGGVLVTAPAGSDRTALVRLGVAAAGGDVIAVRDAGRVSGDAWVSDLIRACCGDKVAKRSRDRAQPTQSVVVSGGTDFSILELRKGKIEGALEATPQ